MNNKINHKKIKPHPKTQDIKDAKTACFAYLYNDFKDGCEILIEQQCKNCKFFKLHRYD